jgi:hypothetical protein
MYMEINIIDNDRYKMENKNNITQSEQFQYPIETISHSLNSSNITQSEQFQYPIEIL